MEKFEVNILGCGSALPTMRHFSSAQVVNVRDKLFMIDCGEGAQLQLRRSRLKFSRLNHIFISHLHGDHCFGLMGLVSTFGLLGRTEPLHIYAPSPLESILRPQLDFFCQNMGYEVQVHEIHPEGYQLVYEDRSLSVYAFPLRHRITCMGFHFCEKPVLPHIIREKIDFYKVPDYAISRIKQGEDWVLSDGTVIPNAYFVRPSDPPRSYAYCSDTSFMPALATCLQGVDLLYHEATFIEADKRRARETFHSTAREAAEIACKAGARKLCIGHFSARYDDESTLLQEASAIFPNTILARENLNIVL